MRTTSLWEQTSRSPWLVTASLQRVAALLIAFPLGLAPVACGSKDENAVTPGQAGSGAGEGALRQSDTKAPLVSPVHQAASYDDEKDALDAALTGDLAPEHRALQVVGGAERTVDAREAIERGLAVVDLSDDWAPSLFDPSVDEAGLELPNRYRDIFVGLANDKTDGDGQPLTRGEKNHLELFGIPPSLSVLHTRFVEDKGKLCTDLDFEKLNAIRSIPSYGTRTAREVKAKYKARIRKLNRALAAFNERGAGASTWDELVQFLPKLEDDLKGVRLFEAREVALAEVEKRMQCEGRLDEQAHALGTFDSALRKAVVAFQEENMLLDRADVGPGTLEAFTRSVLENNVAAFRRVVRERVAHAGGFIEDGSGTRKDGRPATYRNQTGEDVPVPNLIEEATSATLARLGLQTAEDVEAFFLRRKRSDFAWLKAAVRFPQTPEYYQDPMDLLVEIDRGDVWYDFPFNERGKKIPQYRRNLPALTLFVRHRGQKVPLARLRTTIGGWRPEMGPDGHDYLRYKVSDVGPRVWRHIVASPVWIPPESTPLKALVKRKFVNGRTVWATNYGHSGPGYDSAYGLAMAIHVERRQHADGRVTYYDNGIRTHGSVDYRSLLGRFSHGCHRLYNNLAVRLFSFAIKHRAHRTIGPVSLNFRRRFLKNDRVFDMRLPVRGFYYELTPPLPVEVLEGRIRGKLEEPFEGYVMKPWVEYPHETPPTPPAWGASSRAASAESASDSSDQAEDGT